MIIGIMGLAFSLIALVIFLFSNSLKLVPAVWIWGLLSLVVLAGSCVFLIYKTKMFWYNICFDEKGIKITNSKGKIKREICWCDVRKFAISRADQKSDAYICISSNIELAPIYLYMYGIVNATLYDKNTISLPATTRIVRYCEKNLSAYGITAKYTGLVRDCNTQEMQEFIRNKRRKNNIVSSIIGLIVLVFVVLFFWSIY